MKYRPIPLEKIYSFNKISQNDRFDTIDRSFAYVNDWIGGGGGGTHLLVFIEKFSIGSFDLFFFHLSFFLSFSFIFFFLSRL